MKLKRCPLALHHPSWADGFFQDSYYLTEVIGNSIQRDEYGEARAVETILFNGGRHDSKNQNLESAQAALEVLLAQGVCK